MISDYSFWVTDYQLVAHCPDCDARIEEEDGELSLFLVLISNHLKECKGATP